MAVSVVMFRNCLQRKTTRLLATPNIMCLFSYYSFVQKQRFEHTTYIIKPKLAGQVAEASIYISRRPV